MKNTLLLLAIISLLLSCSVKENQYTLKLRGSESMNETFQELIDDFNKIQDTIKVTLEGGGSRTGLVGIFNEEINIGLSSFPFNLEELYGMDHGIQEKIIAYDGIVLINNKNNPLQKLTHEQISGIYSGKYTDWSELGGNPGPIIPVTRDQNSGTQKFFSEYYNVNQLSTSAVIARENAEIVTRVRNNPNGIGFIGFAYFSETVHHVLLKSTREDTFVAPSIRTLNDGLYPLKRSLRIYYRNEDPVTNVFLQYLETPKALQIVESFGLITLPDPLSDKQLTARN